MEVVRAWSGLRGGRSEPVVPRRRAASGAPQVGLALNPDKRASSAARTQTAAALTSTSGSTSLVTRFVLAGAEQGWREVRQLHPGGLRRRREGDPPRVGQALAPALCGAGRTSPTSHGRSTRRRELDQLIRPLLPDRADPDPQGHQRLVGALGHAEVQAVAPPSSAREPVPGGDPNGSLDLFAHWEWGAADGSMTGTR
jgi:hypothetical protein